MRRFKTAEKEHRVEYAHHRSALYHGVACSGGCAAIENTNTAEEERTLAAAGFQMKQANTPERMKVAAMPQRKFIKVPYHDGTVRYVWADDEFCKCLYAGTEAAYGRYWKLAMNQAIATDEAQAAMVSDLYGDSGAWGGWGPWY